MASGWHIGRGAVMEGLGERGRDITCSRRRGVVAVATALAEHSTESPSRPAERIPIGISSLLAPPTSHADAVRCYIDRLRCRRSPFLRLLPLLATCVVRCGGVDPDALLHPPSDVAQDRVNRHGRRNAPHADRHRRSRRSLAKRTTAAPTATMPRSADPPARLRPIRELARGARPRSSVETRIVPSWPAPPTKIETLPPRRRPGSFNATLHEVVHTRIRSPSTERPHRISGRPVREAAHIGISSLVGPPTSHADAVRGASSGFVGDDRHSYASSRSMPPVAGDSARRPRRLAAPTVRRSTGLRNRHGRRNAPHADRHRREPPILKRTTAAPTATNAAISRASPRDFD